ncbi:MAG: pilus assembly protein, partial [Acidobacteria bacterium]
MAMLPGPGSARCEHGQATVAFVAVVPALVLVALALIQLALAGYATIAAGTAARAAARADYVGAEARRAARRALPPGLRDGIEVEAGPEGVEVE